MKKQKQAKGKISRRIGFHIFLLFLLCLSLPQKTPSLSLSLSSSIYVYLSIFSNQGKIKAVCERKLILRCKHLANMKPGPGFMPAVRRSAPLLCSSKAHRVEGGAPEDNFSRFPFATKLAITFNLTNTNVMAASCSGKHRLRVLLKKGKTDVFLWSYWVQKKFGIEVVGTPVTRLWRNIVVTAGQLWCKPCVSACHGTTERKLTVTHTIFIRYIRRANHMSAQIAALFAQLMFVGISLLFSSSGKQFL